MMHSVFRQLFRFPGFSLTVTVFLGVSVAALLALATASWALLGKPLPYDPATLIPVATTLLAVAMAAAWWPARHAGRVAPIEALRQE